MNDDTVEFLDSKRPGATAGDYTLSVHHQVGAQGNSHPYTTSVEFSILGERLALTDDLVHSVFPPAGSEGPFHNLLPHVVLQRSTLPWERTADGSGSHAAHDTASPWMALLLFEKAEAPALRLTTLAEETGSSRKSLGEGFVKESADHDTDGFCVIDLKKKNLARLLPAVPELAHLTHVRSVMPAAEGSQLPAAPSAEVQASGDSGVGTAADKEQGLDDLEGTSSGESAAPLAHEAEEQAIVVGNRLIEPEKSWVAHLVSLEGRNPALWNGTDPESQVTLVSLYHWTFATSSEGKDLAGLLTDLEVRTAAPGGRAVVVVGDDGEEQPSRLDAGAATAHLHTPPGLPPEARPFLLAGYTLLPHQLRTGDRTASWYRGPLVPQAPAAAGLPVPTRSPDSLLIVDKATGCFDVSFAAAWELGRLLALEDAHFGVELLHWKRARRHGAEGPPNVILRWLRCLAELQSIPFDYLVPDEGLLPVESIRFFRVDPDWIAALVDGAYSIGRVLGYDEDLDREDLRQLSVPRRSGILLRSAAVSGFPALEVDGYQVIGDVDAGDLEAATLAAGLCERLEALPLRRLGPNVLLCLFDGDVDVVDLHVHPQAMHFGFDLFSGVLKKQLRSPAGGDNLGTPVPVSFRDGTRVLKIDDLFSTIKAAIHRLDPGEDFSDGDFAFQLLEAPELVRFHRSTLERLTLIQGIGPEYSAALRAADIKALADLRRLLHQPQSTWPPVAGCSADRIRDWAHHAELLLIPGADEHQVELLVGVGVAGLTDLAGRDAAALQPQLEQLNTSRSRKLAPWVPSVSRLSDWIREAARIIGDVGEEKA